MQRYVIFVKKKIENKYLKDIEYHELSNHCYYTGNIGLLRIEYVIKNIVYLKKFQWLFIMDLTMIISLL